jgi:aerobic-type carbon monoxide dehydrogenase small subunit (CoxS/CutS family)
MTDHEICITVNGVAYDLSVEARTTLADAVREQLDLTGTHLGCEHGVCGACTVLVDDEPARACLVLAARAHGRHIVTIEGYAEGDTLHPIQQALHDHHGFQCGFCAPGIVATTYALLRDDPHPSEATIRHALGGNLCRCTGYESIVDSILAAAATLDGALPTLPIGGRHRSSERP